MGMPKLSKVREILLYSETVTASDVRNFFDQVLKSRIPFLGFLDFSGIFSLNVVRLIITKKLNTIHFYVNEKRSLSELSLLVFPYKISEPMEIERVKSSLISVPKWFLLFGGQNFLDFTVKEKTQEINLRIVKFLGKFLGFGSAIDENGNKSTIISTSPEKFMMVDMAQNPAVFIDILDPIPKRMSVTSRYPIFEETGITVGVDNFDVFQHTLFVGASGTGKSKALYAMIKAIEAKYVDDVKIVVIDPHGEFVKSLSDYKIVNLIDNYIEPLDVGGIKTPLMTQLIAQLLASSVGQENKYSERVLFYSTHILSSIDKMDLRNISLLLTDSSRRAEFISECDNDEVKRFFDEEFNDIYIHHFNDAVLPILNFVGEYELYLGGEKIRENLFDLIAHNRITVVSFNPNFFGKNMINFLAGAVINQMYILAITEKLHQPTILIVDEFQRVETKVARDILAETRKFNLYFYMSMQYLGQMSKEVHDSVISNIRNIVAFKSNRQDATMLSSIMEIKIEESFKKARSQTELEESKKEMFVRLHQKECIVRLFDGKKYILPMKLKVVDVAKWGYKEVAQPEYTHLTPMQHKPGYKKPHAQNDQPEEQPQYTYSQSVQERSARKPSAQIDEEEESQPGEEEQPKKGKGPREAQDWSSFKMEKELEEEQEEKPEQQGEEEEVIRPQEKEVPFEEEPREEKEEPQEEKPSPRAKTRRSHAEAEIERLLQRKPKEIAEEEPSSDNEGISEVDRIINRNLKRKPGKKEEEEEPSAEAEPEDENAFVEEEQGSFEEEAPVQPSEEEERQIEEEPAEHEEEPAEQDELPAKRKAKVHEEEEAWEGEKPIQRKSQFHDDEEEPPKEEAEAPPKRRSLAERLRRIREESQSRMNLVRQSMKEREGHEEPPFEPAQEERVPARTKAKKEEEGEEPEGQGEEMPGKEPKAKSKPSKKVLPKPPAKKSAPKAKKKKK